MTESVLFAAEFRCIAGLQDKNYAFLEFRSVEEASNCMAFDGVVFNNTYLRVNLWALLHALSFKSVTACCAQSCFCRCA